MTNDAKSKFQPEIAPAGDRIAYYEQCYQGENCISSVIILDIEGRRLKAFHVIAEEGGTGPCGAIMGIWWLTETRIAAECHVNPSLGECIETDLES